MDMLLYRVEYTGMKTVAVTVKYVVSRRLWTCFSSLLCTAILMFGAKFRPEARGFVTRFEDIQNERINLARVTHTFAIN